MGGSSCKSSYLLLCRFDLLHIMIDEPDEVLDERIANHIIAVHQRRDMAMDVTYTMAEIQNYIKYARTIKPELTPEVGCRQGMAYGKSLTCACLYMTSSVCSFC